MSSQGIVLEIMEKEKILSFENLNLLYPVTRGALSRIVKILIKEGYLEKVINPNNKSKLIIIYTD